jgi:hypothetical protein
VASTDTKLRGLLIVVLLGLTAAFLAAGSSVTMLSPEAYQRFASIEVGMTRDEVLNRLGPPDYQFEANTVAENYCVEGYSCSGRPIEHRLYVYLGGEPIAYIYLDHQERVEDVYIGGS